MSPGPRHRRSTRETTPTASAATSAPPALPASLSKRSKPSGRQNARKASTAATRHKPAAPRARARQHGGRHDDKLTSHPISRAAYIETREWLLAQHGPVCAYCGVRFTAKVMTLDHVAPRRGQKAYDRRDNLVLACPGCNMIKRDQAPLAFLLGKRSRAVHLLAYGSHLSPMLVDLARSLVPQEVLDAKDRGWDLDDLDDGESPYRD